MKDYEITRRFDEFGRRFDRLEQRLDEVLRALQPRGEGGLTGRLATLERTVREQAERITRLEEKT